MSVDIVITAEKPSSWRQLRTIRGKFLHFTHAGVRDYDAHNAVNVLGIRIVHFVFLRQCH